MTVVAALCWAVVTGAIFNHHAIQAQLVNGTAHRPPLVLYTPAVSYGYCGEIAKGFRIATGLARLCWLMPRDGEYCIYEVHGGQRIGADSVDCLSVSSPWYFKDCRVAK